MADSLFRRAYYWSRLRANPLGTLIEEYVAHFRELGYTWLTVRARVQSLEHFGSWLGSRGLGQKDVSRDLTRYFLREHVPRCRCSYPAPCSLKQLRPALKQLLRLLREKGLLTEVVHRRPIDAVLEEFNLHLREVCGLSVVTCEYRVRYARAFLGATKGDAALFGPDPLERTVNMLGSF